jgi:ATP-dependent RNA helicase MSS116
LRAFSYSSLWRQQAEAVAEVPLDTISGPIKAFQELGDQHIIHPNVIRALTNDMGLSAMTDVQILTIDHALKGKDM